jgi:hypothetical protein
MNDTIDDSSLDEAIRALLAARRPRGAAPAELRNRLESIADRSPGSRARVRLLPAIAWLLGLVAVVAAVTLVAVYGLTAPGPGPGASPLPSVPALTFDPSISGPGIVEDVGDPLHELPWVIGGLAALILAVLAVVGSWLRRATMAGAVLVIFGGILALVSQPGVSLGGATETLAGTISVSPLPASGGKTVAYVSVLPGQPFVIGFDVTNAGQLPIRLLGLVEDSSATYRMRWTALWTAEDSQGPDAAREFEPLDLEQEDRLQLYLVGRAGPCALGRAFDPASDNLAISVFDHVSLAYSVLGLPAAASIELPFAIAEPQRENCLPSP